MFTALRDLLYRGPEVSIRASDSIQEAAARLAKNTPSWKFPLGLRDTVVGSVAPDRVTLFRIRPFLHNAGAPVFRGRFVAQDGATRLTGRFVLDPIIKGFFTLWFGGILLFCVASLIIGPMIALEKGDPAWLGLLAGGIFIAAAFAMAALGYGFVKLLRWFSKSDIQRIVKHVEAHIGSSAV